MSTTKHTTIEQLKKLALRTKNEIGLVDAKVAGLTTKVNDLVTAAISTALESYYTKTQVDETFVKKTDIVMATDEEVDAMLTEVFGAQATV